MLSKYYHLEKNSTQAGWDVFVPAMAGSLGKKYGGTSIERVFPGGTLGIFFVLYMNGKRKFAKTHHEGAAYQENLEKEIEIMSMVYKEIIEIEKAEIVIDGKKFVFMIMDYLFPYNRQITPKEVRKCIHDYQQRISGMKTGARYSFSQILDAGRESLETLHAQGFFSGDVYLRCMESLQRAADKNLPDQEAVCHGDLSSVNIMCSERGDPVVIDWEDSLAAFPEYDYLYWLTFFSQRRYYASGLLESSGIDKIWGTDIMVLVTVVKSAMSYLDGSYRNNKITFQDRVCEIYSMTE